MTARIPHIVYYCCCCCCLTISLLLLLWIQLIEIVTYYTKNRLSSYGWNYWFSIFPIIQLQNNIFIYKLFPSQFACIYSVYKQAVYRNENERKIAWKESCNFKESATHNLGLLVLYGIILDWSWKIYLTGGCFTTLPKLSPHTTHYKIYLTVMLCYIPYACIYRVRI